MILAHAHVFPRVDSGTALTNDDASGGNQFATVAFPPRRLEFESRPFLELPPAFLCAMLDSPYAEIPLIWISV